MAQFTTVLPNSTTATFRANANNAFASVVSLNSGPAAPPITIAFMLWADTNTSLLKIRNAVNTGWIVLGPLQGSWLGKGSNVASAASVTLPTDGAIIHVTGVTPISALVGNQSVVTLIADGLFSYTHNSNLLMANGQNLACAVGTAVTFFNEGSGVFREIGRLHVIAATSVGISVALRQFPIFR